MSYKNYTSNSFSNSNKSGAIASFRNNALIERAMSEHVKTYDFYKGKSIYYGRIDTKNNAVNVDEAFLQDVAQANKAPVMCLNFVADAFQDMRKYIKIEAKRKLISDNFLNDNWDAKKGWESPHVFYDNNMNTMYEAFVKLAALRDKKEEQIFNLEDFIRVFMNDFYKSVDKTIPLTKSGAIMSRYFNPTNTGLCIETSEESFSSGYKTINKYLKSPNYEFYTLAAAAHGFMIDKRAPWRLIANLNSPVMLNYMSRFGLTKDDVHDVCYYKTYQYDIPNLKAYFQQMYATYTSFFL